MKSFDLYIFLIIIVISTIISFFYFDEKYNYSDIITFLSIMIGFKITSLSILFSTPLKKSLYDRKNNVYKTELHRLRDFFKHSLYFEVLAIVLLFILPNYKHIFILPIIFGTVYCFYKTYSEVLKIFVYPTNN